MEAETSKPSRLADLAEELRQQGRLPEALEAVERCLQESPDHPRGLLLLARILCQSGRYRQALKPLGSLERVPGIDEGLKGIMAALRQLSQAPEPQLDRAFVTETMAELHIRQGYLWEAAEIYRQLYLAARGEERLWEKILTLRDRLMEEGSRETRDDLRERLETLNRWIQDQQRGS